MLADCFRAFAQNHFSDSRHSRFIREVLQGLDDFRSSSLSRSFSPQKAEPLLLGAITKATRFSTEWKQLYEYSQFMDSFFGKSSGEREAFFAKFADASAERRFLRFATNRILPSLIVAFENFSSNEFIASEVFCFQKISSLLGADCFRQRVFPLFKKLLGNSSQSLRVMLLEGIGTMLPVLSGNGTSDVILDVVLEGLRNQSVVLRESSLRAAMAISPLLSARKTNKELLPAISHVIFNDPNPTTSANALLVLSALIPILEADVCQHYVISILCKGLAATSTESIIASLHCVENILPKVTAKDLFTQILPLICPILLLDCPDAQSRSLEILEKSIAAIKKDRRDRSPQIAEAPATASTSGALDDSFNPW